VLTHAVEGGTQGHIVVHVLYIIRQGMVIGLSLMPRIY